MYLGLVARSACLGRVLVQCTGVDLDSGLRGLHESFPNFPGRASAEPPPLARFSCLQNQSATVALAFRSTGAAKSCASAIDFVEKHGAALIIVLMV
jgi:hypothetical protein